MKQIVLVCCAMLALASLVVQADVTCTTSRWMAAIAQAIAGPGQTVASHKLAAGKREFASNCGSYFGLAGITGCGKRALQQAQPLPLPQFGNSNFPGFPSIAIAVSIAISSGNANGLATALSYASASGGDSSAVAQAVAQAYSQNPSQTTNVLAQALPVAQANGQSQAAANAISSAFAAGGTQAQAFSSALAQTQQQGRNVDDVTRRVPRDRRGQCPGCKWGDEGPHPPFIHNGGRRALRQFNQVGQIGSSNSFATSTAQALSSGNSQAVAQAFASASSGGGNSEAFSSAVATAYNQNPSLTANTLSQALALAQAQGNAGAAAQAASSAFATGGSQAQAFSSAFAQSQRFGGFKPIMSQVPNLPSPFAQAGAGGLSVGR